ncbi:MAG: GumC family protein [Phycisphaerales bacterium]
MNNQGFNGHDGSQHPADWHPNSQGGYPAPHNQHPYAPYPGAGGYGAPHQHTGMVVYGPPQGYAGYAQGFMPPPTGPGMHNNVDDGNGAGNIIKVIRDRMHNRWKPMLIVGAIVAVVLAPLGFLSTEPKFESRGLVHVAPKLDYVVRETPETEIIPFYMQFVQSQAAVISSERVLIEALKDEKLKQYPWALEADAIAELQEHLRTEAPRNLQHIVVIYESGDAVEAATALNAILTSYEKEVGSTGSTSVNSKQAALNNRRLALAAQINARRSDLRGLKSVLKFDTTDLADLQRLKVAELERIEGEIDQIRIAESISPAMAGDLLTEAQAADIQLTTAQLDALDPQLSGLRRLRDMRRIDFEDISERMGENSGIYQRAQRDLEAAERLVSEREQFARNEFIATGGTGAESNGRNTGLSPDQLRAKKAALTKLRDEVREDVRMINADRAIADVYHAELQSFGAELAIVQDRDTDLNIEGESNDRARINVFQKGTVPPEPANDRRPLFAIAGFLGGFGASFAIFFLLGTIDSRAYRVDQLNEALGIETLGVLPDLNATLQSKEASETAAHCVHQIRNFIEARRHAKSSVLAITSPFQGDGKTSITVALGMSYAAAGHNVVVVDGDMVGRGLSRQLGLVGQAGVREAILSGSLNGEVVTIDQGAQQLNVLPVGVDIRVSPESLRRHEVELLFQQLRDRFDIVLVDTGPVLGSLESVPIVTAADATILAVRRGRQRERMNDCMRTLQTFGARVLGVVLNCAEQSDCYRYVSEMSLAVPDLPDGSPAPTRENRAHALMAAMSGSERTVV